jgi:KDO2-lipid IV(A) lauroyltransferase
MAELKTHHNVLYHAFRVILRLGCRMPLSLTRPIGRQIGLVSLGLVPRDRRRARSHLRIAFPDLPERDIRRLLLEHSRHFGTMLAEVTWLWRASSQQVLRLCSMEGTQHLRPALEAGGGAVLVTAHCGNWELLNARLCMAGLPMTVAVRSVYDPRLDRLVSTLRSRFGTEVVPRGADAGRNLVSALARNRVNGLLIDQDIRDIPGVFVPFFDRPAWTPSGAAALAIRGRCPTVPAFIHRLPDGTHHVVVHPPLPIPEGGSLRDRVTELTAASTAAIERQIRSHPEQWVWMHRRWRTQPPTE